MNTNTKIKTWQERETSPMWLNGKYITPVTEIEAREAYESDLRAEIARLQAALAEAEEMVKFLKLERNVLQMTATRRADRLEAAGLHPDCKHEEALALAQRAGCGEPVAWMTDDGRVATDRTKMNGMARQSRVSFNIPLYTTPPAAVTDADKRDAERYRWIRSCGDGFDQLSILDARGQIDADAIDSEIDANIAASAKESK